MKDIYYESSKDTSSALFAQTQKEFNGRLHFHRAFELAYILSGNADYVVEDERFVAFENSIVFCHCYYRHKSYDNLPHKKHVIAVPENLTSDISAKFKEFTLPSLLVDTEFNKTILPYFNLLTQSSTNISSMVMKGYANIIFGLLAEHYESVSIKSRNKNIAVIADILSYIDANFREPLTLDSLASVFGYNKTYFSRIFNRHIGMSLNNYLNMVRLTAFEERIKQSDSKSVADTAFECGFTSLATFYRVQKFRNLHKK